MNPDAQPRACRVWPLEGPAAASAAALPGRRPYTPGLAHPAPQRLGRATDLGRDRFDSRPLRLVLESLLGKRCDSASHYGA